MAEKFRCDPAALIDMTHIDKLEGGISDLIFRGRRPQICHPCAEHFAQGGAEGAIPKHWSKAWRITCPVCGGDFADTNEHRGSRATLLETTPFAGQWSQATAGEQIVERYLAHGRRDEHSPIAILQLLLVQTWKLAASDLERPAVGWVLGALFPDFDARARPIKRRVTHAAITTLPIEFRPALLAGLARVAADPAVLHDLRKATLLRGQRNFDKLCREAKFELPEAAVSSHQ